jgi:hypothetical protein
MEKSLCPRTDLLTNAPSLTIDVDYRIMEKMLRVAGLSVALAVVMVVPNRIQGQTTNNLAHTKKSEAAQETPAVAKKPGAGPFHGNQDTERWQTCHLRVRRRWRRGQRLCQTCGGRQVDCDDGELRA